MNAPLSTVTEPLAYSVNDACRISSLGRTSIYAAISEGRLKARKLGKRTLIDAASLRSLVTAEAA